MANLKLLRETLQQIDRDPGSWDQSELAIVTTCGTSHCFAGWAAVLAGHEITFPFDSMPGSDRYAVDGDEDACLWDVAQEALEINDLEAAYLFHGGNSRDNLEMICTRLAADEGEPLWPDKEVPCDSPAK